MVGTATTIAANAAATPRDLVRVLTGFSWFSSRDSSKPDDRNDCGIVMAVGSVTQNGVTWDTEAAKRVQPPGRKFDLAA